MKKIWCFLALALLSADAAKILGFFAIPSYSHQIVYRSYMQELARRGHEITIITPNPVNETLANYKEIDVSYIYDYWRKHFRSKPSEGRWILSWFPELAFVIFMGKSNGLCQIYLSDPQIQKIILEQEQFDAFVVEFGPTPCVYPFSRQTNGIMIGMFSFQFSGLLYKNMGSTSNPAYITEVQFPYSGHMSVFQRLRLVITMSMMELIGLFSYDKQHKTAQLHFGSDTPPLFEFAKNVSLLLPHTHFTTGVSRPNTQTIVDIGGPPIHLHGVDATLWPENTLDIKEYLDNAEEGLIYFSFGSNVKGSLMSDEKRIMFLNVFRRLKMKVLWKWEAEDLPDKPDNVMIKQWCPQTQILAHPNVKAFITQGGLQSMGEATHFMVPMVVIPLIADQDHNAMKLEAMQVAVKLEFDAMTEDSVYNALKLILTDPKYKENIVKYSELTKDQPQSPMDRAIWWTEYVLRHNGAPHLRSTALGMPWYQYFMIDVIGFLLAVSSIILYLLYVALRLVKHLIFGTKISKQKND